MDIITKQLKELDDNFIGDKIKYFGKPITEEILTNYEESSSWMRANIFMSEKRILSKTAVGFIGTGGGANIFDYLFRDKSSRAILFAHMPYHQKATYTENKSVFDKHNVILKDDNFFMFFESEQKLQQISSTSEHVAQILCESCLDKMNDIIKYTEDERQFENCVPLSLTVDFGSGNDKPARFFISCKDNIFGYLFSEKQNREKMNNTIAIIILNILSNEINNPYYEYKRVEISKFPKRTADLIKEENRKYYDDLYQLI